MKIPDLKLTRIGNSWGVPLPVALIKRYGFSSFITVEVRDDGLLLKPQKQSKLSWEETAREMAASDEDWSEWECAAADGLERCPWDGPSEAEFLARQLKASSRAARKKKPDA